VDVRRHLYHARISKHLSLQQVGTRTALSPSVLRNIDEGRFELLPSGLYARSYVRTFAAEVGLDPEATLARVEHLLPGAPDPLPTLNQMKSRRFEGFDLGVLEALRHLCGWLTAKWTRVEPAPMGRSNQAGSRAPSEACPETGAETRPEAGLDRTEQWPDAALNRVGPGPDALLGPPEAVLDPVESRPDAVSTRVEPWTEAVLNRVEPWPVAVLDGVEPSPEVVLNRVEPWPETVLNRVDQWLKSPIVSRCTAAAIDALTLLAVDTLLVLLVSLSSGMGMEALLRSSRWALGTFCAIPIALYFVLFEGIAGTTLGRWVCSLIDPSPDRPLTLLDILRRSVFR
jgi:hypothetical protein